MKARINKLFLGLVFPLLFSTLALALNQNLAGVVLRNISRDGTAMDVSDKSTSISNTTARTKANFQLVTDIEQYLKTNNDNTSSVRLLPEANLQSFPEDKNCGWLVPILERTLFSEIKGIKESSPKESGFYSHTVYKKSNDAYNLSYGAIHRMKAESENSDLLPLVNTVIKSTQEPPGEGFAFYSLSKTKDHWDSADQLPNVEYKGNNFSYQRLRCYEKIVGKHCSAIETKVVKVDKDNFLILQNFNPTFNSPQKVTRMHKDGNKEPIDMQNGQSGMTNLITVSRKGKNIMVAARSMMTSAPGAPTHDTHCLNVTHKLAYYYSKTATANLAKGLIEAGKKQNITYLKPGEEHPLPQDIAARSQGSSKQ